MWILAWFGVRIIERFLRTEKGHERIGIPDSTKKRRSESDH
jgi:hypothetical protein